MGSAVLYREIYALVQVQVPFAAHWLWIGGESWASRAGVHLEHLVDDMYWTLPVLKNRGKKYSLRCGCPTLSAPQQRRNNAFNAPQRSAETLVRHRLTITSQA